MAGHSHWAKIKRAKATTDARRGREWSKLAKRIIVAAKTGGGNPDENLQLRYSIDDAKAANMPNHTIDNAIKKGIGELGAQSFEAVLYEGYGPGGVAIMVDCLTDNRNRTAPEMRKIFERAGGQLGASNCVTYLFTQKGTFTISADAIGEDDLIELALDAGADDVTGEGDAFEVTCAVGAFQAVKGALADKGVKTIAAEIAMVPNSTVSVSGDKAEQMHRLMDTLEDHEDTQNVYANFDIPEEVAAKHQ